MMRRTLLAASLAVALSAIPMAASAARGYALGGAQIFAGPGSDYPVVAQLGTGVSVNVNGCLADYSWCDVTLGRVRGWVYAGDLGYPYRSRRVPILEYGPTLSLPIITFSLGNYWDRYYRGRPFYRERNQWEQRWHDHDRARYDEHREFRGRGDYRTDFRGNGDRRDSRDNQGRNEARGNQEREAQRRAEQQRGEPFRRSEETHSGGRENGNESGSR